MGTPGVGGTEVVAIWDVTGGRRPSKAGLGLKAKPKTRAKQTASTHSDAPIDQPRIDPASLIPGLSYSICDVGSGRRRISPRAARRIESLSRLSSSGARLVARLGTCANWIA